MKEYNITVLKGDGIGPEIVDEAIKVLNRAGEKFGFKFNYNYQLLGGCAIDATGVPYPQETADACKASQAVLLGAVGGPKWDSQPGNNRPEKGLLAIREDLGLLQIFALQRFLLRSRVLLRLKKKSSVTAWIFSLFVNLQAVFISETVELMRKTALQVLMIPKDILILKLSESSKPALNMQ